MYLLERWPGITEWDVEIVSSDIDTSILRRARAGRYSARSIQNVPPRWLEKYFKAAGDEYQLSDDLRHAVEFTRVNLSEAAETFYEALDPGGFICLGHSESMSRISSLFKVRKFPDAIVYQKGLETR